PRNADRGSANRPFPASTSPRRRSVATPMPSRRAPARRRGPRAPASTPLPGAGLGPGTGHLDSDSGTPPPGACENSRPMGRIFEVRKHTMFARWDRMSKAFSRINKEINVAVKSGGTDPHSNPALRRVIQNARAVNMPKDKVEAAIKRASGKDATSYDQIIYEGYAPHGVAVLVECATDNPTRTVASVRTIFSKNGGNLGAT